MRRFLVLSIICFQIIRAQEGALTDGIGLESIKSNDLKKYLVILASDSLEGRETAYPGQRKAAGYISDFFSKINLTPAGDSGTFFQHFEVEEIQISPETRISLNAGNKEKNFVWGDDFFLDKVKDTTVAGQAVFIGFTDTELTSEEEAKIDGRIVFAFIGKKEYAGDTSKSAAWWRLRSFRSDKGAAAVLMITDEEGNASFRQAQATIRGFGRNNKIMIMKNDRPYIKPERVRLLITPVLAEEVLRLNGKSLKQLKNEAQYNKDFRPVFIDSAVITIHTSVLHETKKTENVIGIIPGSDSDLKAQAVVFSAHYDHLGRDIDGNIYYGADDNASGTAAVLEVAEAFSLNPVKPKRSLIFLMTTGEEKGLLGSSYYSKNPVISLDRHIADINLDMIGRMDAEHAANKDTNYIYVIGSNMISPELDSLLRKTNGELGQLTLDYRFNGEDDTENFYYRNDSYQFARNGIPIVFFFSGLHTDYHKPSDTANKIIYNRIEKVCRIVYRLGWKLGNFNRLLTNTHDRK
jgi:hypothetical protein